MKLSHLTDKILLLDTKKLVAQERAHTLSLLYHLKEIDRRKLYVEKRCSSLFDYCLKELGYSEGAAQRRIVAARLLHDLPEIAPKIEAGSLNLTNISQVNQFFKTTSEKREALHQVEGLSKKECEKKLFEMTGKESVVRETKERVSSHQMKVAIVLDDKTILLMDEVKELMGGHKEYDELIAFAMRAAIEKIESKKFKQTKERKSPPPAKVGRYVSASTKRAVYSRDKRCTQCGGKKDLQFDHRVAFALGGTSGAENIRLLCRTCNDRARIRANLGGTYRTSGGSPPTQR